MIIQKQFYLMRHGQSADNALGLISGGGSDPDLTEIGRAQAVEARAIFSDLSAAPAKLIASGLKRAQQTAALLAPHLEFTIDADLNERHLGTLDGKISEQRQKELKMLPEEESGSAHFTRVIAAINRHLAIQETVLFVCHAGTIRRVLEATELQGRVAVENARIYHMIPHEAGWEIVAI